MPKLQEHPDLGPCYAHSGILAAAKAVWADLEEHGILAVLLNAEKDGGDGEGGGGQNGGDAAVNKEVRWHVG